jgi:glutamate synthase domain-containing protein 1
VCGQCGFILNGTGLIGQLLTASESAMVHRGPDSTGFALYGEELAEDMIIVRARLAQGVDPDIAIENIEHNVTAVRGRFVSEPQMTNGVNGSGTFLRILVNCSEPPALLLDAIESVEGTYVHSMGRRLEIIKDVGTAEEVAACHGILNFIGTHGLAHSRLATESTVDVELSHPFWARPYLDVAIVHNGQLTNYYKMRHLMSQRKLKFLTENDSELIAVYIAEQLSEGKTLREALWKSIAELDGVFTYLLATDTAIGCATDPLAIKPLVVTEVGSTVAMATEEQALRQVFDTELVTEYVREGSVTVWPVEAATEREKSAYSA